jgi:hypothetical protein
VSLRLVPSPAPVEVRRVCVLCREARWPWLGQALCQRCITEAVRAWLDARRGAVEPA